MTAARTLYKIFLINYDERKKNDRAKKEEKMQQIILIDRLIYHK